MKNSAEQSKSFISRMNYSLNFNAWMGLLEQSFLSDQDQALFFKGLQDHPEWIHQMYEECINQMYQRLLTPLMRASYYNHIEVIKVFIQQGVVLNVQDSKGWTALMFASLKGHEAVKMLIEAGADCNLQDKTGCTALMRASSHGNVPGVKVLIQAGAALNLQDSEGGTALMLAASNGHQEVVKELIRAGAHVNLQDQEGFTALMHASHQGCGKVVQHLILQGADPKILNRARKTALILAREEGCKNVMSLLEVYEEAYTSRQTLQTLLQTIQPMEASSCSVGANKTDGLTTLNGLRL